MTTRQRKQATAWPGWQSLALASAALAVAVVAWWYARAPQPTIVPAAAAASAAAPRATSAAPVAARAVELPAPPVAPYVERGAAGVATDDPLTAYRKANVYPPTSRPLTADQVDLLRPNQRHETMRPVDRGG